MTPVIAPNDFVTLVELEPSDDGNGNNTFIPPSAIVEDLATRGFGHIMVEGGPATARAFLEAGVVDRAILVRASVKFETPMPAMMDESTLKRAGLHVIGTTVMGDDRIEYWTRHNLAWPSENLQMWT